MEPGTDDIWNLFSVASAMEAEKAYPKVEMEEKNKKSLNDESATKCSSCGTSSDQSVVSEGFSVCLTCGTVRDVHIENTAEWRSFATNNGRDVSGVRCGAPPSIFLPDSQLSTYIGDRRLQRFHQRNNLTGAERKLHKLHTDMEQLGDLHNLPKTVILETVKIYKRLYAEIEATNSGIKRCNVRQGLTAACLYYACRQMMVPRERKTIAEMLGTTTKVVTKGCNEFLDIMGGEFIQIEPFVPSDFVERYSQILEIPFNIQKKLERAVRYVSNFQCLSESNPTSITAACIHYVAQRFDLNISKEDIQKKCGPSQAVVSKVYKILKDRDTEIEKAMNDI